MRNFSIFVCVAWSIGLLFLTACIKQKNSDLPTQLLGSNIIVANNIIPPDLPGTWRFSAIFASVMDRNENGFATTNSPNNPTTSALNTLTNTFNTVTFTFALNEDGTNTCALSLGNLQPDPFFAWIDQPKRDISQLTCQVTESSILVFLENTPLLTMQMNNTKNQIFMGLIDKNNQAAFNLNYVLKGVVWVVLQR